MPHNSFYSTLLAATRPKHRTNARAQDTGVGLFYARSLGPIQAAQPPKTVAGTGRVRQHYSPFRGRKYSALDAVIEEWPWDDPRLRLPDCVQGAAYAQTAPVQDVSVDHGGLRASVTKYLLDRADVVPILEQVSGEETSAFPRGTRMAGWLAVYLGRPILPSRCPGSHLGLIAGEGVQFTVRTVYEVTR